MSISIGTTYEGKNLSYLNAILPHINHIEISPDSIAERKNGRVLIQPDIINQLIEIEKTNDIDILIHGVGLSIGSYDGCSKEYLLLLDQLFHSLSKIRWHSEHLAYTMVKGESLGTMLTLPRTDEVIELICHRVDYLQKKYGSLFLLENVSSMLPSPPSNYTDAQFLNRITSLTGCGLILDVYNIECDANNFDFQIQEFIEELDLNTVYEMHLAGGNVDTEFNFMMDVHSRLISKSTIELAASIILRKPQNLKAITFELLEEFIGNHGFDKIIDELEKLKQLFNPYAPSAITNQFV